MFRQQFHNLVGQCDLKWCSTLVLWKSDTLRGSWTELLVTLQGIIP
jgi:hypothetical protein